MMRDRREYASSRLPSRGSALPTSRLALARLVVGAVLRGAGCGASGGMGSHECSRLGGVASRRAPGSRLDPTDAEVYTLFPSAMQAHVGLGPPRVSPSSPPRRQRTLDALAQMDCAALETLFASADAFPMHALVGHPRGRVLALPGRDRGLGARVLRALHARSWWPWEGKSFAVRAGPPRA